MAVQLSEGSGYDSYLRGVGMTILLSEAMTILLSKVCSYNTSFMRGLAMPVLLYEGSG